MFFNFSVIQVPIHIHNPFSAAIISCVRILNKHILLLVNDIYPQELSLKAATNHPLIQPKTNYVIPSQPLTNALIDSFILTSQL